MPALLLTWSGLTLPPEATTCDLCPWHHVQHTVDILLMSTALTHPCVLRHRQRNGVELAPGCDNSQGLLLDSHAPTPVQLSPTLYPILELSSVLPRDTRYPKSEQGV